MVVMVFSAIQAAELRAASFEALQEQATRQTRFQEEERPTRRFLEERSKPAW